MNGIYNQLLYRVAKGLLDLDSAVVLEAMLLRDTGAYTFEPDDDVVDDILATGIEITVASYARIALSSKAVTLDDTNDRGWADCDNIAFGTLESGQTVEAIVIYEKVVDDTDSIPLIYIDGKINITAAAPAIAATTGSITDITQDNPGVVTSAAHNLSNGTKVRLSSVGGMTEVNGNVYTIANVATNTFELSGTDTSAYGAYTSGGDWDEVINVYVEKLDEEIPDAASVDFGGGATGTVNGLTAFEARKIEVIALGADVTEGDVSSDVATTLNLPVALGGGAFNININVNGWLEYISGFAN
jgi:hypothetical protein